ncbi:MAG: hypothetical protein Q9200_001208 [Gallowayella weberi]
MNISATLNFFRLIKNPSLCLPHATIPTFNHLPVPLSNAFGNLKPDIRAVVLDKDNCFALPKENVVYKPYTQFHFANPSNPPQDKISSLFRTYPPPHLLIVSNSAGSTTSDPHNTQASLLASTTSIPVLKHSTKKPGCGTQILNHFLHAPGSRVTSADQIAVVGDRLFTDVMLANLMGSWSIWVRDGVIENRNSVSFIDGQGGGVKKR